VEQATYHFGFQADVAFFHWLSDLDLPAAMLIIGQLLNGVMALQVFLLARWLGCSRRTGLLAALIVALISTMPAYYVSWGRYTQLAGLAILPAAVVLTTGAVESPSRSWHAWALALLAVGGLTLTHYRVLAFYICLMGAYWIVRAFESKRSALRAGALFALLFIASMLVLMPWLFNVINNLWARALRHSGSSTLDPTWDFSLYYVTAGFDQYILSIAGLGAAVGFWRRKRFPLVILLWLLAVFIVTNPSILNLPGEGLTNNIAMLIAWFMPLSILSAYLFDTVITSWMDALGARWQPVALGIFGGLVMVLTLVGIRRQIAVVNPVGVLFHPSDEEAMVWIEQNTPTDSLFLINATRWYPATYAGSDGGFWISPLTRRRTTVPPVLSGLGDPDYVVAIQDLAHQAQKDAKNPEALWNLMKKVGADYVYVGARGGPLSTDTFLTSKRFQMVYANSYVSIFETVPSSEEIE
jgi:hypothetical protein